MANAGKFFATNFFTSIKYNPILYINNIFSSSCHSFLDYITTITKVTENAVTILKGVAKLHGKTGHIYFFWKQFKLYKIGSAYDPRNSLQHIK